MKGDDLPDAEHVVRYASGSHVLEDGEVDGSAFLLSRGNPGLSVNWLEYFTDLAKPRQLNQVRQLLRLKRRPSGRFAELNVGATGRHLHGRLDACRFIHEPSDADNEYDADPSHSEIIGLPPHGSPEAALIGDMIAECVEAVHPALAED